MIRPLKITFALLFLTAVTSALQAETILEYQTATSENRAPLAPSVENVAITGDDMVGGGGIEPTSFATWNWTDWDPATTSFAAAVAADEVWTWGFDVTSNVFVDLTSFEIRLDRSGTGPDDFEIQASVNGGPGVSLLTHDFGDSASGVDFNVDLNTIDTLGLGDSIVFTLGAFNSESTGGTFDLETIDFNGSDPRALRIYGDVSAVPEPSTFFLALIGMVGLVTYGWRRRLRQA